MDVLREAVDSAVHENITTMANDRTRRIAKEGRVVLAAPDDIIREMAVRIVSSIDGCIDKTSSVRSLLRRREHAMQAFRSIRCASLMTAWERLYEVLNMVMSDPILAQSVNDKIFNCLIVRLGIGQSSGEAACSDAGLSLDEMNALRHAAGYIPFRLLKRYRE